MAQHHETSSAENRFVLSPECPVDGTHLFATVRLSPTAVERRFGPGQGGDGFKISRRWIFKKGDLVFTLYDWKATTLYDCDLWTPAELWASAKPCDLHIGSKAPATQEDVAAFVAHLESETSPAIKDIESVVEQALEAFWESVARQYPTAKTGDLSPKATIAINQAASEAVEEWVETNVPVLCETCGSEIVETINGSIFDDGDCGPCEYDKYRRFAKLRELVEAYRQECSDQLQQCRDDFKECFGDPDDVEERLDYWKERRDQCNAVLGTNHGKAS